MEATFRQYNRDTDYDRVGQFLVRTYGSTGPHVNWLQPRWEYMHFHPLIRDVDLSCIGLWEADGEVVAVVHPEHGKGWAYFEFDPAYESLREAMLTHAEDHIADVKDGKKSLHIFINDRDEAFQALAAERGYTKTDGPEPMSQFVIPDPFPAIALPDGFRLKSLADDNDLPKLNRVIFRGFNHGAEPPDDGIPDREFMQSAPNYRKDLNVVVEAPDGHFVSYCGMWHDPVNGIAYVEPVCTDPDFRRLGLASAAVLEGIRRCGQFGATAAYVGTDKPVYLAIGFCPIYTETAWRREWGTG